MTETRTKVMPAIALTYAELEALIPCEDRFAWAKKHIGGPRKWNGRKVTAAEAAAVGATFEDILWVASALAPTNEDISRRLRLWMADCAARVLHVYERQHPDDMRIRDAITAARQFARGEIDDDALDAALDAAEAAARAAGWDARAARKAEEKWQFERLIAWLSDEELEDWPLDSSR